MLYWDKYKPDIYEKWRRYWFEIHPQDIAEYSWNYLFNSGKEIRPKLFCELWHYLSPDSEIKAELGFAIECIHVASMILDDTPWMDNASERRGKKTLHIVFTPKKALLIAYELLYIALQIWSNNKPECIDLNIWYDLLKSKMKRLTIGQWYDLDKKGTLLELASLKTGVLFELVTETVAICIEVDLKFWRIWGNNLGILFQWMDDWYDREEDILQKNRNAFNENYEMTYNTYKDIWSLTQKCIGKNWFSLSFGKFMINYFTSILNNENIASFKTLESINIYTQVDLENINYEVEEDNDDIFDFENYMMASKCSKSMLNYLWKCIDKITSQQNIINTNNMDLWAKDESQWEDILRSRYHILKK